MVELTLIGWTGVMQGLEIMKRGEYGAEKLVYII